MMANTQDTEVHNPRYLCQEGKNVPWMALSLEQNEDTGKEDGQLCTGYSLALQGSGAASA